MNFRTTLFLLVLVVAVGITIFFVSRHDENTKTPDKTEERKLVDFDSADVTRVSIANYDGKRLVLQKTGGDWNLVEPVAARARTFEVDDLVRALTGLKSRSQLDPSKKTSGGLDHPSFVVELATKSGKAAKLSFGDNSTVGDSLYVLVDNADKPDVVGNSIYATLDKPASNYRDMKLVNVSSSDFRQLAITEKGRTIKLEKNGENWEMTEPARIPAENSAVSELLSSITNLDATQYVDSPSTFAVNGLAHPRLSVEFSKTAPSTQPATSQPSGEPQLAGGDMIRFGGYQDITKANVFVSLNGKEVAIVPASSEKSLQKTPLDLRNRDVVTIEPDRISSFTISINKPATTQPTTQPAEVKEFTIERHKPEAPVLGPALPGGVKAPATQPAEGPTTRPAVAKVEPSGPTTRPAVATAEPSGPTTRPSVATTQPSEPTTRPSLATTQPSEPATQTTIAATQASKPTTQPDEAAAAKWVFTSGGKGAAEEGQVTELLDSLHPLRAEKYIEPEAQKGATYTLTLHVIPAKASESAEDIVLKFVDAGSRIIGSYKDLQFEASRGEIEKLTGDFKTRKPAPPAEPPPSFHGGGGGPPFGG